MLERSRARLLERRAGRIRPFRDGKVIAAWNGLMIAALAKGGAISGKREYVERAVRAASFILENMRRSDGRLLRSFLGTASDVPAFLEDYACLSFGLLELFEATLDSDWLDKALKLTEEALRLFRDPDIGQLVTIGQDAEQMPERSALDHDGVTPSAVSMMAQVLARLSWICHRPELADFAHQALSGRLGVAKQQPIAHLGALRALAMLENEPVTITFSGGLGDQEISNLLSVVKRYCLHDCAIIKNTDVAQPPGVQVCGAGTCNPAVRGAAELEALLVRLFPGTK
jgi:uncharacterized protein YyaL (SSP411 family)